MAVVTAGVATVAMVTVAIVMPVATLAAVAVTTAIAVKRLQVGARLFSLLLAAKNLRLRDFFQNQPLVPLYPQPGSSSSCWLSKEVVSLPGLF